MTYHEAGPFTAIAFFCIIIYSEYLLTKVNQLITAFNNAMGGPRMIPLSTEDCEAISHPTIEGHVKCDKCKKEWKFDKNEPPPCIIKKIKEMEKKL